MGYFMVKGVIHKVKTENAEIEAKARKAAEDRQDDDKKKKKTKKPAAQKLHKGASSRFGKSKRDKRG